MNNRLSQTERRAQRQGSGFPARGIARTRLSDGRWLSVEWVADCDAHWTNDCYHYHIGATPLRYAQALALELSSRTKGETQR